MNTEIKPRKIYWYGPYEGHEGRRQRRLLNDLGFNETASETILRMHKQILELQSDVCALEAELTAQAASQNMHLAHYREVHYEAVWIEINSPKV